MSTQISLFLPAYDEVTLALFRAAVEVTPAELHGLLTGLILGGERNMDKALKQVLASLDEKQHEIVTEYFQEIFQVSGALLENENFIYELLLPDDAVEITERLQALSQWCHGFLTAFKSQPQQNDAAEVKEAVEAIAQIAEIDSDVEKSEQAENDYWQLVEFLRMSVILIYEDRRFNQESTVGVTSEYVH